MTANGAYELSGSVNKHSDFASFHSLARECLRLLLRIPVPLNSQTIRKRDTEHLVDRQTYEEDRFCTYQLTQEATATIRNWVKLESMRVQAWLGKRNADDHEHAQVQKTFIVLRGMTW